MTVYLRICSNILLNIFYLDWKFLKANYNRKRLIHVCLNPPNTLRGVVESCEKPLGGLLSLLIFLHLVKQILCIDSDLMFELTESSPDFSTSSYVKKKHKVILGVSQCYAKIN